MPAIAQAHVEITAKTAKYKANIASIKRQTMNFGKSATKAIKGLTIGLGLVAAAATAASIAIGVKLARSIIDITKRAATMGDTFHKMSLRVGESAARLSELKFAADISGVSMNEVETGIRRLSQNMNDFATGTGEARETFEALGLTVLDANGNLKSSIDVMIEFADKLESVQSESQKVAFAQELLGRSGSRLLPLLKEGSEGMRALTARARELGLVIDDKAAAASAEFNDRLTELRSSIEMIKFKIGSALIPALQPLVEHFTDVAAAISNIIPRWGEYKDQVAKELRALIPIVAQSTKEMMTGILKIVAAAAPFVWVPLRFALETTFNELTDIMAKGVAKLIRVFSETGFEKAMANIEKVSAAQTARIDKALSEGLEEAMKNAIATINREGPPVVSAWTRMLNALGAAAAKFKEDGAAATDTAFDFNTAVGKLDFSNAETSLDKLNLRAVTFSKTFSQFRIEKFGDRLAKAFGKGNRTSEAFLESQKAVAEQWKSQWVSATSGMQMAFENFIGDAITDFDDLGSAWKTFVEAFKNAFIRMIAEILADKAVKFFFDKIESIKAPAGGGGGGGGGRGGGFDLWGMVNSVLSSAAGAAAGVLTTAALTPVLGPGAIPAGVAVGAGVASGTSHIFNFYETDLQNMDPNRIQKTVEQTVLPSIGEAQIDGR